MKRKDSGKKKDRIKTKTGKKEKIKRGERKKKRTKLTQYRQISEREVKK